MSGDIDNISSHLFYIQSDYFSCYYIKNNFPYNINVVTIRFGLCPDTPNHA